MNIEDIKLKIKNNAKDLLGEDEISLYKMKIFSDGYCFALYQNNIKINYDKYEKFCIYIEQKYGISRTFSTEAIIRFFSENDEDAFYNYFKELEGFEKLSEDELKKITR